MTLYLKVMIAADGFFYLFYSTIVYFDYFAAGGTDEVMVVAVVDQDIVGRTRTLVDRTNQP
jgi:hypothetical protein